MRSNIALLSLCLVVLMSSPVLGQTPELDGGGALYHTLKKAAGLIPYDEVASEIVSPSRAPAATDARPTSTDKTPDRIEYTKRLPRETGLPRIWHFEDYGLLLNPMSLDEAMDRVHIVPTPWSNLDYELAVQSEWKTLESYLGSKDKPEQDRLLSELAGAAVLGNIEVNDYVDLKEGDNLFFLRLRRDFQFYNEDVEGVTINWERDYESAKDDFYEFHGAVMLDAYLDPLYRFNISNLLARKNKEGQKIEAPPSRGFLRFGAEWDKSANGSEDDEDVRKYYALYTFWTHRLLPPLRSDNPQVLQIGALYEDDALADLQNLKMVFNWEPRLQLVNGFSPSGLGQFFALGRRMHFADGNPFTILNMDDVAGTGLSKDAEEFIRFVQSKGKEGKLSQIGLDEVRKALLERRNENNDHFFIRPKIGMEQIFEQTGLINGGLSEEDLTFALRLKTGFTLFNELATVSYNLVGQGSIQDYDGLAVMHEVRLDVKFFPRLAGDDRPGEFRSFAKAYLAYQNGEEAPSFRKVDRIAAGLSFQF